MLLGALGFGFYQWRHFVRDKQVRQNYELAVTLIKENKLQEAQKELILSRPGEFPEDMGTAWTKLELEVATRLRDLPRLAILARDYPEQVREDESASLLLARQFINSGNITGYEKLRQHWSDKWEKPLNWSILEIDQAIRSGAPNTVIERIRSLLNNTDSIKNPESVAALLERLAILQAEDLQQARSILTQALQTSPENPDLHTFLANIEEATGNIEIARRGYVAAHLYAPENPRYLDNLAEYYRRRGMIRQAIDTWQRAPAGDPYAIFSVKAWFWNKLVFGQKSPLEEKDGPIKWPLSAWQEYTRSIDSNKFWNFENEDILFRSWPAMRNRREVFWLQVMEKIRSGEYSSAFESLKFSKSGLTNWVPELNKALLYLLEKQALHAPGPTGSLSFPDILLQKNPFWPWIQNESRKATPEAKASGDNTTDARRSKESMLLQDSMSYWAFSAACLAEGWLHAGILLAPDIIRYEQEKTAPPAWYVYGLSKSLQLSQNTKAALQWLESTDHSDGPLLLLKSELLMQIRRTDEAVAIWKKLSEDKSAGLRANWLLGLWYLEQDKDDELKKLIAKLEPESLQESAIRSQLLARLALKSGDPAEARRQYSGMAAQSEEALIFLMKDAFSRDAYQESLEYNTRLREKYPNEPQFLENEIKIRAALESEK